MVVETMKKEHLSMDTINAHKARIFEEYRSLTTKATRFHKKI